MVVNEPAGGPGFSDVERRVLARFDDTPSPGALTSAFVDELGGSAADHFAAATALLRRIVGTPEPVASTPPVADPLAGFRDPSRSPLFLDLELDPYEPVADPSNGVASIELLRASCDGDAALLAAWDDLVERLCGRLGPGRVVWAVKWSATGVVRRELYFFAPPGTIGHVFDAVRDVVDGVASWTAPVRLPAKASEFSIEPHVVDGVFAPVATFDVTIPLSAAAGDVVVSYGVDATGSHVKNVYGFHHHPRDRDRIVEHLNRSRFRSADDPDPITGPLASEFASIEGCDRIWVADKPDCDGLYVTRCHFDGFVGFLHRHAAPDPIGSFVVAHADRLGHLRFDTVLDYVPRGERIEVRSAGFFGFF